MGYAYLLDDRRLAQGSAPPPAMRLPFDTVVLTALEYQPQLPGYQVVRLPLDDGPPPDARTRARIHRAASDVANRVQRGERVLVTCWQGRNRSGVVAGLALVALGVPGVRAAAIIRQRRNGLTNPHFLDMVVRAVRRPPALGA